MKKSTFFKTLLLAAGLLGGSNAWAQTATWTMSSSGTYTAGMELSSNTDVVSIKLGGGTWEYNSTWGVLETTTGTSAPTKTDNIPTTGNYLVIVPAVDVSVSLDERSNTANNFVLIESSAPTTYIYNNRGRYYRTHTLGTAAAPLKAGKTYYAFSTGGANLGYRAFTAKSVESYTIHYVDDSATPVIIKEDVVYEGLYGDEVTASENDMAQITYNDESYAYSSGNETITLSTGTNEITLVYENVSSANYTIKYVDSEANSIADDVVIESYVGAEVTASGENLPTYITYNDVKYEYASGNNTLTVTNNETSNVITLVYNVAPTYSYTIKTSLGTTITSGSDYKNETVYYHYPKVLKSGTTLYTTTADNTGVDGNGYKSKLVLSEDNLEVTKTYTTGITNVLFLAEGEDIFTRGTGSTADTRCSMGAGGYASSKTSFVTLPAGTYNMLVHNRCSNTVTGIHKFYKGEDEEPFFSADGNGYNADRPSGEFTLTKTTTLYMQGGNNTNLVDYLYIYGTVTATITSAGYATYCSPFALDFSEVSGLTAYIITGFENDPVLALTPVTSVPANTGVLLQGEAGNYSIPVATSSSTDVSANKLVGVTEATPIAASAGYVLMNESNGVGFYQNSNAFTVGANTAYLPADFAAGAKARFFGFGNDATGIKTIAVDAAENVAIYNLSGQRVNAAYKGIVIKNGKKYLNK